MGGATTGDGEGTEEEKQGDQHLLQLFSRGCVYAAIASVSMHARQ